MATIRSHHAFFAAIAIIFLSGCSESTVQKKLNVLESVSGRYDGPTDLPVYQEKCRSNSVSSEVFQGLLSNNVKVVNSAKWQEVISYYDTQGNGPYNATCMGTSYIVEGPDSSLKSL